MSQHPMQPGEKKIRWRRFLWATLAGLGVSLAVGLAMVYGVVTPAVSRAEQSVLATVESGDLGAVAEARQRAGALQDSAYVNAGIVAAGLGMWAFHLVRRHYGVRRQWRFRLDPTTLVVWSIGGAILIFVVGGYIAGLRSRPYPLPDLASLLINGLAQGGIYALIALGYTMVYGVLQMINFAHSEVFISGPYIASYLAVALNRSGFLNEQPIISLLLILLLAMTTSTTLAVLLERVAYRPLRRAPRLVPLITAIGASFFLQYSLASLFGRNMKRIPDIKILTVSWSPGGVNIKSLGLVIIVAAVVMMAGLYAFIRLTKTGKAIRAVAEDKDAAALMGINVDRIIAITFAIGGMLAGAAGVLYVLWIGGFYHTEGFVPGIKAFTCAVLGGIGNIPGAMVGGIFLGVVESLGPGLFFSGWNIPSPDQLRDVIAFTMLVLVLIFRPTGILGEVLARKKA